MKFAHHGADHMEGEGQADPYFLVVVTLQQRRHAGAEQALRCLGLLLDGIRLVGIAACSLRLRQRYPKMAASISVGLGSVI